MIELVNPFDSTQIIFSFDVLSQYAISLFSQPAGAFLTLGTIIGVIHTIGNVRKKRAEQKKAEVK